MKPIEPGALCLVISGPHAGDGVTAVCYKNPGDEFRGCVLKTTYTCGAWIVENEKGWMWVDEHRLLRIDGHEEPTKQREAESV